MTDLLWPDGCWATTPPSPLVSWKNVWAAAAHCLEAQHDVFAQTLSVRAAFLDGAWCSLSEKSLSAIRRHFVDAYNFDPRTKLIGDVVSRLAWDNPVNPLASELNGLRWDGARRCEQFFIKYCGATNSPRVRASGRLFWRMLVRRALEPGCDCQVVICLVSPQGAGKSTLLRIIAGDPSRFTDQEVIHLSVERQQEALKGRWLVEGSEMGGFDKASIERGKAFISRTFDRARAAWGRSLVDQPRTFIVVVTSNERRFLKDSTGNRRFLPVLVKRIDLAAVARDREQLLAEAIAKEAKRLPLRLPRKLWRVAERATTRFMVDDPWDDTLANLCGTVVDGEERLPWCTVWDTLGFSVAQRSQGLKRRIIDAMRRLGWRYNGQTFRIEDKTFRGFER